MHLYGASRDSMDFEYWTAAGVLIVHSAIAFADALCIQQSGQRSVSDDHDDTVPLLDSVIAPGSEKGKVMNNLRRIIEAKTQVSYSGELITPKETKEMWQQLERFRRRALTILNR